MISRNTNMTAFLFVGKLYFSRPFAESPAACRGDECMPYLGGYKGERIAPPLSGLGPCEAL
jgi:hypothetical protein